MLKWVNIIPDRRHCVSTDTFDTFSSKIKPGEASCLYHNEQTVRKKWLLFSKWRLCTRLDSTLSLNNLIILILLFLISITKKIYVASLVFLHWHNHNLQVILLKCRYCSSWFDAITNPVLESMSGMMWTTVGISPVRWHALMWSEHLNWTYSHTD